MPVPHAAFRQAAGSSELELRRSLTQPIERVWSALITPERIAAWMGVEWLGGTGPLHEGAAFDYRFADTGAESRGRVLRLEPPHTFEHSWFDNVPPGAVVRWELTREGEGCRLQLTHRFGAPDDAPRTAAGWSSIIEALAASLGESDAVRGAGLESWRRLRDVFAADFPPEATRDGRAVEIDAFPALRFDRRLARPVETVWAVLAEPEGLARWLQAEATIEGKVGGRFDLAYNGGGGMQGVITRWEPPRVLEYSWTEPQVGGDSVVRFELEPTERGCRLVLTHILRAGGDRADFASGWHWHLDALDSAVEGHARLFDKPRWELLRQAYAATL